MSQTTNDLHAKINQITDLNKYLESNKEDLTIPNPIQYLLNIASSKRLSKSDIVRSSQIERSFCYHLLDGSKTLTREKALALAFGAKLSQEETQNILKYAQLPRLYPRNPRDSVILFCLNKGVSLMDTNIILDNLGFDPIC